jgi:hypothetical protein
VTKKEAFGVTGREETPRLAPREAFGVTKEGGVRSDKRKGSRRQKGSVRGNKKRARVDKIKRMRLTKWAQGLKAYGNEHPLKFN